MHDTMYSTRTAYPPTRSRRAPPRHHRVREAEDDRRDSRCQRVAHVELESRSRICSWTLRLVSRALLVGPQHCEMRGALLGSRRGGAQQPHNTAARGLDLFPLHSHTCRPPRPRGVARRRRSTYRAPDDHIHALLTAPDRALARRDARPLLVRQQRRAARKLRPGPHWRHNRSGPLLLYFGNEGAIEDFWNASGALFELAPPLTRSSSRSASLSERCLPRRKIARFDAHAPLPHGGAGACGMADGPQREKRSCSAARRRLWHRPLRSARTAGCCRRGTGSSIRS